MIKKIDNVIKIYSLTLGLVLTIAIRILLMKI
ncbi:hypothetical protein STAIW_v1c06760 [Spiroplasma taiwanense CT-1]|uniref:Uncharacterized protein n=1 Tax=Spiroplasma taiwanense CT-1 TaxID=1276220 RepID=S5LU68_9MOLU|nr:hypothetical protein STAIW_v1c06760 [Spiroplasma taiwanense CT-1]